MDLDPKIVIGKIIALEKHPNADRLQLAKIDIGKKDLLEIVCGANNLEAEQIVPVALPGAKVKTPSDGLTEVKKVTIRGVKSTGIMCSPLELDVSDNHEEILILPKKLGKFLGKPLKEIRGWDNN